MKHFLEILRTNKKVLMLSSLVLLFLISFIAFLINYRGAKYSFRYMLSGTDKIVFETRTIAKVKNTSKIKLYVDELLLGPSVQRAKPLFPLNTKVLFCFEDDNELFLNLSEEAILNFSPDTDLTESYRLIELNVLKNFSSIKKINVFIEGNPVYTSGKN